MAPGMIFDIAAKLYSAFNYGCVLFVYLVGNQKEGSNNAVFFKNAQP